MTERCGLPRLAVVFAFCLLPIFLTCQNPFAPAEAGDDTPGAVILTQQRSPDEVLVNFLYAYSFKDSLVYADLLDSTFTFISLNYNESPPVPINWGRDEELKTVGRMFRFFNTLDLTWNNVIRSDTLEIDTLSNSASLIEQELSFTLTLDGGSVIPTLIGRVEYIFIRRGAKWFIAFWEDRDI